ncbi:hypothetical protein F4821DRAFT_254671 [Hypoxylon rubiginosum]|uniref:Uncharacterized protein n=1 Tax=Hypoxylon rubiginosum TaxID=110542 RepID=A0ACC0DHW3_9PEZI|nr:hypothetical protein F4821DRAFT_254671 [Hypoxylon rubiginosum]
MTDRGTRKRSRAILLQGFEVAIADTLGPGWTATDVSRWVTYHGGVFKNTVEEGVTHLLATPEQFKQKLPAVKKALALKTTHIVTQDWLEDTLEKRRRQKERDYSLKEILREENEKNKREERARKGIEQGETFVNTNLYHIYRDETYFPYEVTITRDDEAAGTAGQKYILYLWESNAKPHLYHFVTKFLRKHRDNRPVIYRPHETPGLLKRGLDDFRGFFQKKTGIHWDERIAKQGTMPADKFQYQPPTGGKPVGLVPEFFLLPSGELLIPIEPALSTPTCQGQDENTQLAPLEDTPHAGTKRGPEDELTLPDCKKQKTTTAAKEDSGTSNLSESHASEDQRAD